MRVVIAMFCSGAWAISCVPFFVLVCCEVIFYHWLHNFDTYYFSHVHGWVHYLCSDVRI